MPAIKKLFFGLALVLLTYGAHATVSYTTLRSTIGPGYDIDWGALGGDLTAVSPPASVGDVTVSGAVAFTMFTGSTYNADFLPTDNVLALFDLPNGNPVGGTFNLVFGSPVLGAGAQVQSNSFGSFGGLISAYDSGNFLLGSFPVSGSNSGIGDGSAVFAGISSDSFNIKRLEFSGFGDGAGINHLSVRNVPEPGSLALLLTAMALTATVRRRRQG